MESLFSRSPPARRMEVPSAAKRVAERGPRASALVGNFETGVDERLLEIYNRARNPEDPFELRDLWLGRVEYELGRHSQRAWLREAWVSAIRRRSIDSDEVLGSRSTVRFIKELFNWYFRDDLYGVLRGQAVRILSSGAVDETSWGLATTLKQCMTYALERDWYGYSDSRGRMPCREAVAAYENVRIGGVEYGPENVALTMGATMAISSIADFVLRDRSLGDSPPALCAIPNYPPLVQAIANRSHVQLVPLPTLSGVTSLEPLIAALRPDTPMVFLQTVGNPTGASVREDDLTALIRVIASGTTLVLDECHEWLGPDAGASQIRASPNVVRVSSLSKTWSAPGLKIGWILADERFVSDYYEYASTSYGGPPSFYYTLVEVFARMERWLIDGVDELDEAHRLEFEPSYGIALPELQRAYADYRRERSERNVGLRTMRTAAANLFSDLPVRVLPPQYSVNMAVDFQGYDDSYLCFRQVLRASGVSLLPGVLTYCLSGAIMRVTPAQSWPSLANAIQRIADTWPKSL